MTTLVHRIRRLPVALHRITASGRYRPEIDGLRFFAIAIVLLGHLVERVARVTAASRPLGAGEQAFVHFIPGATTGVLLFFTISGYILGMQFERLKEKGETFKYHNYLVRRITRIAPPYYVMLLIGFVALSVPVLNPGYMNLGNRASGSLAESLLWSLLFLHGTVLAAMPRTFPPGWSLEIEIHFYLVAPILFALIMRVRAARFAAWKWCILGASVAVTAASTFAFGEHAGYYFSLVRFLPFFLLGPCLVLALDERARGAMPAGLADAVGFCALLALCASGVAQHSTSGWINVTLLDVGRMIAVAGMFVGAVRGRHFRAMCSLRWISFLGGACFSIYLCHLQVLQVLTPLVDKVLNPQSVYAAYVLGVLIQLPVAIVASLIFYVLVERQFMRPIDWRRFVPGARRRADGQYIN